jgi:CheY-like chemotaxis protein
VPTPARRNGWHIIATDSHQTKLNAITEILRDAGHCVFPVQDGRSALQLTVQLASIDLVVTNTRLNGMSDRELIRLVRSMRPSVRILHIVAGKNSDDDTPSAPLNRREPFTANELVTAVASLMD